MSHHVVGLDVGTKGIKIALVLTPKRGKPLVASLFTIPSAGLQKGVIVDEGEACAAIGAALEEVKKAAKPAMKNIYLNVGGKQTGCQVSKAMVPLPRGDSRISEEDMDRVTKAAETMVRTGHNRMVIYTVTREYAVDGIGDIMDPVGLNGARLEANCLVIDAFSPNVQRLMACVEKCGGAISGPIYGPLAAARAVLSRNQKDLGVVLIDIGFGTTGVCIYEEQKLLHTAILPVGAGNITNDIALGLKIPVAEAENLKLSFGYALSKEIPSKEGVPVRQVSGHPELDRGVEVSARGGSAFAGKVAADKKINVSRRFLSEIIEVRCAEIFELVNEELKRVQRAGQLPAGAVLTGGGAKLPGLVELAKRELKLPAQIGIISNEAFEYSDPETGARVEDPEYVVALGLALHGQDEKSKNGALWEGISMPRFLRYFMP
ncbi:MAG: cell division protein FtsA [bacterium]|nr:cell division protein FtsA [bacterium]